MTPRLPNPRNRLRVPSLCESRAELAGVVGDEPRRQELLREAQQRYAEIGAPLHAERIGREIS